MERCRVLCLLYGMVERGVLQVTEETRVDLSKRLKDSLEDLEPGWRRIDGGFRVARSLSEWLPAVAQEYLGKAGR